MEGLTEYSAGYNAGFINGLAIGIFFTLVVIVGVLIAS